MNGTHTFISNRISGAAKKICLMVLITGLFTIASAQKTTVKGFVVDQKGNPVSFATIKIFGTRYGTATNDAGAFVLNNVSLPGKLICSATGFSSTEKILNSKDSLAHVVITIEALSTELSTVTVVTTALGVRRQPKELGYAATTISDRKLTGGKATGVATALSGKISSVSVSADALPVTTVTKSLRDDEGADKKNLSTFYKAPPATTTAAATPVVEAARNAVSHAGMLTAGEVNDFKKWKMWEDYSKNDFESYSKQWALFATHRYSVQLQNTEFAAITGEKLFLINRQSGDTLWTAVSDNTGKAELWAQFTGSQKDDHLVIAVEHEKKDCPAVTFMQGVNRITLNRGCNISDKVQIAFLVDATGSMQDEINYLKEETEDVLEKIVAKNPSLQLQTAAVFYRDKGDAYLTNMRQFSTGIKSTVDFIKAQNADGGGDYPESVDVGLDSAVQNLAWNTEARTKIIFLLMDAPPHMEAKDKMAELIRTAAAKGIRIVPVACSGTDKMTEFIMRSMALATNGTYLFLTDDSGIGNSHIKPTTDEFKVEHLNDLLQRTIEQMCFVNPCGQKTNVTAPVTLITNTFKVNVYPNPTNGPITLETSKKLKEIFVTDFTGKILRREEVKEKSGRYHIDLSGFPSAVYLIRYVAEDGVTGMQQVVLMR